MWVPTPPPPPPGLNQANRILVYPCLNTDSMCDFWVRLLEANLYLNSRSWFKSVVIGVLLSYCISKGCNRGGYSHIWPNGDVPLWWVAFLQEILKHGSCFLPKKSLNMGQLFWLSPKLICDFRGFGQTPKFLKNRPTFEGKSLKMGTLFDQNHP